MNNLYCAGCSIIKLAPQDCGNCPNLFGNYHKYNSLLKNYELLMESKNNNFGRLGKLYQTQMDKFVQQAIKDNYG